MRSTQTSRVYLPCQDLGMDLFRSCLTELEQLVCESKQLGPGVVLGDFNAHLGNLGGLKGNGNTNVQGLLLHQHIVKSDLFVASLSEIAYGWPFTYFPEWGYQDHHRLHHAGCLCSIPTGELWYPGGQRPQYLQSPASDALMATAKERCDKVTDFRLVDIEGR